MLVVILNLKQRQAGFVQGLYEHLCDMKMQRSSTVCVMHMEYTSDTA